jgi:hypothetical protein
MDRCRHFYVSNLSLPRVFVLPHEPVKMARCQQPWLKTPIRKKWWQCHSPYWRCHLEVLHPASRVPSRGEYLIAALAVLAVIMEESIQCFSTSPLRRRWATIFRASTRVRSCLRFVTTWIGDSVIEIRWLLCKNVCLCGYGMYMLHHEAKRFV